MCSKIAIAFVLVGFFFMPASLSAGQQRLERNPIKLLDDRAPSGKPFAFETILTKDTDEGSYEVFFVAGDNRVGADASVEEKEKKRGDKFVYTVKCIVPAYSEIFRDVEKKWYEGWWSARRAQVHIKILADGDVYERSSEFAIPLQSIATLWGAAVLFILYLIIFLMKLNLFPKDKRFNGGKNDIRIQKWEALHPSPFVRRLIAPLHLTATPIGNCSISSSQILFWSALVIFSSVYVFFCRSDFLVLTGQVLTLLGISGGTALTAKGNALVKNRDIPEEFFSEIERTRVPRFKDLICISGIPNIFKFQIFAFTLVNGIIVLRQLYTDFNFPVIPAEQLTLMGISSGVYLGNEIIRENEWEAISKKVKEANEARTADPSKLSRLSDEISRRLESIYDVD